MDQIQPWVGSFAVSLTVCMMHCVEQPYSWHQRDHSLGYPSAPHVCPVHATTRAGWGAALSASHLGRALGVPSCLKLLTKDRVRERRWEWGRDHIWTGGTRGNTEPCWKSSFHECEIIMWVFSMCSCQIPVLRVDGIYCCVNFLFILALYFYVYILSEFCLRKNEMKGDFDVFLIRVFEQRWLFILQWKLFSKLNIHILSKMQFL